MKRRKTRQKKQEEEQENKARWKAVSSRDTPYATRERPEMRLVCRVSNKSYKARYSEPLLNTPGDCLAMNYIDPHK